MYQYRKTAPRPYLRKMPGRMVAEPMRKPEPLPKPKPRERPAHLTDAEKAKAWAEQRFQDPPGVGKMRMKVILLEETEHELNHGTYLDYLAHKKRGEEPCPPSLAAYNRARDREAQLQRRAA